MNRDDCFKIGFAMVTKDNLLVVIPLQFFKTKHLRSSTLFLTVLLFGAGLSPVSFGNDYRIGLAFRPQYTYLNTNRFDLHLAGFGVKSFLGRENIWELGLSLTPQFNHKAQIYQLAFEHTIVIGRYFEDPSWRMVNHFGFNLMVRDGDPMDRGGVHVGSMVGRRLRTTLWTGLVDVYVGGFYSAYTNSIRGWGLSLLFQWTRIFIRHEEKS